MTCVATPQVKRIGLLSSFLPGDPPPQVTWWRDSHLIDSSYEGSYSRTVQNGLRLHNVSRAELGAQLTCQASNNNLSLPVSNRVTIDMKCEWVGWVGISCEG